MYVHLSSTQTEAAYLNITMKVPLCVVTVLLGYLTDCSIRVSRDLALWFPFLGREGRGSTCPLCPPMVLILLMEELVITSSSSLYSAVTINSMHKDH